MKVLKLFFCWEHAVLLLSEIWNSQKPSCSSNEDRKSGRTLVDVSVFRADSSVVEQIDAWYGMYGERSCLQAVSEYLHGNLSCGRKVTRYEYDGRTVKPGNEKDCCFVLTSRKKVPCKGSMGVDCSNFD